MALNNKELKDLVDSYGKQQNQHPFLLVDLSGGKENTHTNVLMSLLQFNDFMFFDSFLTEVLALPERHKVINTVKISTQFPAVGLKTNKRTKKKANGFIDLYIEYIGINNDAHRIVIENKINGATDTDQQMLRYIASVKAHPIEDPQVFNNWVTTVINPSATDPKCKGEITKECQNRHFVYLTLDDSKDPEAESLPPYLYDEKDPVIDYHHINYQDDILPWLRETVLHRCPYHDDGIVVAGLRQYIASLESSLSRIISISDVVKDYVNNYANKKKNITDAYKGIWDSINKLENYSDSLTDDNEIDKCNRLARELRKAAEELITKNSVPDGWVLHISPTLLLLYRPEWMRIARGSYSISFVNLYTKPDSFLNGGSLSWQLHIEHFSPEVWDELKNNKFTSTNHNRTACYNLGRFTMDKSTDDNRKKHLENVISKKESIISIINEVVGNIDNNKMIYKNDKEVRIELFRKLVDRLP